MDLIAVLTLDHHLLVHRTTSWQKLLHIKPSDVGFEIVTLVWKPDGLQLAVGCDEGKVTVLEIESGEILPERRSSLCHESCITAMDWTHVEVYGLSSRNNQHCQKTGGVSINRKSQSELQFRHRSSRFLNGCTHDSEVDGTVLVTADERGFVALWWMGKVLMTRIDVSKHFTEEEFRIMETLGNERDAIRAFHIQGVSLAPDFSLLFIQLAFSSAENQHKNNTTQETKIHRLLTLNMLEIQCIYKDVALVASTIDRTHAIVNRIATVGRQMATEWKNSMRLFELKMGLMGPLYEKYACEDPPQVDMLSVVVSGITAPALAQYFAQDIQEMSVHRMQKALLTGCESLRLLVDEKIKSDLVDFLFCVSELRGHLKWDPQTYVNTMGIKVDTLNDLVKITQDILVEMEALTLALHETRQDFALFFQWILERIRVHTNSSQAGKSTSASDRDAPKSKSLLNMRRLCNFLDHAAKVAKDYRKQQPNGNVYLIETSFGNLVSQQLSTRPKSLTDDSRNLSKGSLFLIQSLKEIWSIILDTIGKTLTKSVVRENSGCFNIGSSVEECHVLFRQSISYTRSDDRDNIGDQSEDEESEDEAVDWHALKHYGPMQDNKDNDNTILIGFRLRLGNLLLLKQVGTARDLSFRLQWEMAVVSFSQGTVGSLSCQGFDFYGDASRKRTERLALVVNRAVEDQILEEWLYLQQYDQIHFSRFDPTSCFEAAIAHIPSQTCQLDQLRGRKVASLTAAVHSRQKATSVIANASRGILCVILPPSRLTVYDAEDCEDENEEDKASDD